MSPPGATARNMGTTISKVAAGTEIWLGTHIWGEFDSAELSNFPFIYMLSMVRTWPSNYVASIPEVAAGRGENTSNNYKGAKRGPTAPGRSCQSPTLGRVQQESPSVRSGFPFSAAHRDVWIRRLGPLSVKRKTQYRGWHKKGEWDEQGNQTRSSSLPCCPYLDCIYHVLALVLCKPAHSCMDYISIIENTSLLVSSEETFITDFYFMQCSKYIHSTLDQSRVTLNFRFWHNSYFFLIMFSHFNQTFNTARLYYFKLLL